MATERGRPLSQVYKCAGRDGQAHNPISAILSFGKYNPE